MGRNKMNKFTAAASVALALVAGSAFAADLPYRKEAPVYVPPLPVIVAPFGIFVR